jgi:hypothetical protein
VDDRCAHPQQYVAAVEAGLRTVMMREPTWIDVTHGESKPAVKRGRVKRPAELTDRLSLVSDRLGCA